MGNGVCVGRRNTKQCDGAKLEQSSGCLPGVSHCPSHQAVVVPRGEGLSLNQGPLHQLLVHIVRHPRPPHCALLVSVVKLSPSRVIAHAGLADIWLVQVLYAHIVFIHLHWTLLVSKQFKLSSVHSPVVCKIITISYRTSNYSLVVVILLSLMKAAFHGSLHKVECFIHAVTSWGGAGTSSPQLKPPHPLRCCGRTSTHLHPKARWK